MHEDAKRAASSADGTVDALAVLGSAADGIFVLDSGWRLTFVNPAAAGLLAPNAELIGGRLLELFPRLAGSEAHAAFRRAMAERVPVESQIFIASRKRWYVVHASPLPDGGLAGVFRDITDHHAGRAAQRIGDERLGLALEIAGLGQWELHLPEGAFAASSSCRAHFGREAEDRFDFDDFISAAHPDDRAQLLHAIRPPDGQTSRFKVAFRCLWPDGAQRWVETLGRSHRGEDGRTSLIGVSRDVTEQHVAQEALVRSQAQLKSVFDAAPIGIAFAEAPSGRIIMGNPQAERILGHSLALSDKVPGSAGFASYHPDGRRVQPGEYALARAIRGETTLPGIDLHYEHADGHRSWIRAAGAPVRNAAGEVVLGTVIISDIDDERRDKAALAALNAKLEETVAERTGELSAYVEALQRSRARIRPLFDHSPIDMLLLNIEDGGDVVVLEGNRAFCETVGLEAKAITGRSLVALFGEATGGLLAADCRNCLVQGGFDCHHTLMFPLGERHVRTYYRPVPNPSGRTTRVLLTQLDLTEARRVASQLRQVQRHEAVGQLSGGVAHDFNNLLTAILGSLELLGRRLTDERQLRYVQTAIAAAQRGANLTQQLLAYARKQYLAPRPTDIASTINGMADVLQRSLGGLIEVTVEPAPDSWAAMADQTQLELVLLNLAINARDAMPLGGRLRIATENVAGGSANLPQELEPGDYVRLIVADTGTGMAPEVMTRALEPFFTTKPIGKGSGLGLAQAYGFARQLGGTVRLDSRLGEGTRVEVLLPRAPGAVDAPPPPLEGRDGEAPGPGRVLLVDDDAQVREIAATLLREEGWHVTEAESGQAAIDMLEADLRVDAMLADVGMPGMSGIELARIVRERRPHIPVIFVTGNADPVVADRLDGLVVTKPYRLADLLAMLRRVQGALSV